MSKYLLIIMCHKWGFPKLGHNLICHKWQTRSQFNFFINFLRVQFHLDVILILLSQGILNALSMERNAVISDLEENIKTEENVENVLSIRNEVFEIIKVRNKC